MEVGFNEFLGPKGVCCCKGGATTTPGGTASRGNVSLLELVREFSLINDPNFHLCLRQYLVSDVDMVVQPTPPYTGQYGDLPFQDPWWKILLCLIALLLLIAAAIAEAVGGSGDITVSGGGGGGGGGGGSDCCGISASGGGTSTIAAGLVAAAAAVATVAAASDIRDPFRRGEDHTPPGKGEVTLAEKVNLKIGYPEPVALGKPFAVKADWKYQRITNVATYDYSVSETNNNVHVVSTYEINAPDVVRLYQREPWIVKAKFLGPGGEAFHGEQLFVQCFLIGPAGQYVVFPLQDGGIFPDTAANDGTYTGIYQFAFQDKNPQGIWTYFVVAQDVNAAQPSMTPEQAAQYIGGMVLTHQLTIDFSGGTCPFVPDGHVHVV